MQHSLVAPRFVVLVSVTGMEQQQLHRREQASNGFSWYISESKPFFNAEAAQTTASIDSMSSLDERA